MIKVLVCEDEESIRSFVVVNLRLAGYTVLQAASGEEALEQYEQNPDIAVALLDVMLPGIDGFETCRRLRSRNPVMGIMMLTALSGEAEKVGGLQSGADDYVTKPFSTVELVARVNALCRRLVVQTETADTARVVSGDFLLDMSANTLTRRGETVELTPVECQMMALFFRNPGRLLTRLEILEGAWHNQEYVDEKIVDVNIRRLRMKVERDPSSPHHLKTVWGRGYQWQA